MLFFSDVIRKKQSTLTSTVYIESVGLVIIISFSYPSQGTVNQGGE